MTLVYDGDFYHRVRRCARRHCEGLENREPMKMIYPNTVKIEIKPARKGLCRFFYRAAFVGMKDLPEPIEDIVRRTVKLIGLTKIAPSLRVRFGKNWISVTGVISYEFAGGFLVGEFMPWSAIGNVPLRKLFEGAALAEALKRR